MTKQEHDLMMTLFAIQFQYLMMLAEALQSAGDLLPHDVGAFLELAKAHQPEKAFADLYYQLAAERGISIP